MTVSPQDQGEKRSRVPSSLFAGNQQQRQILALGFSTSVHARLLHGERRVHDFRKQLGVATEGGLPGMSLEVEGHTLQRLERVASFRL